jgi:hypothetical protein
MIAKPPKQDMQFHKYYKRHATLSLLCMISAVIIVSILVLISTGSNGIEKSSFKRKFTNYKPIIIYHSGKISGLRAICGINGNHIYFETDTAGSIIETDSMLSNKRFINFEIPSNRTVESLYTTFIDSSYAYIMAGNLPGIIRFSLKDPSYQLFHFSGNLFSEAVATANGNFMLRVYQKFNGKWDQVFARWNPVKNTLITNENVTEKDGGAGFSTDGMLLFDKSISRILYVPYYRNEFFCMDTSLNVLYKQPTIYTSLTPSIKVLLEISRYSKTITNGSPLHEVNLKSKAVNNRLYIQSGIRADNESSREFSDNAVLDVYQISDGYYLGSYHIPKYKKERLKDFEVTGDKIVALYKNYIVTYSMPPIFKTFSDHDLSLITIISRSLTFSTNCRP